MGATPLGSHGNYERMVFRVPAAVAAAARKGLALRDRFGNAGYKSRTDVGTKRARQLSNGSPAVTLRDIVYIHSYFSRHAVDLKAPLNESKPSNGWMSWLLWGGTPGKKWADAIYRKYVGKSGGKARSNPLTRTSLQPARDAFLSLVENGYGDYDEIDERDWERGFFVEAVRKVTNARFNEIRVYANHADSIRSGRVASFKKHGPIVYRVSYSRPKGKAETETNSVYIGSSLDVALDTYMRLYDRLIAPKDERWPRLYKRMR